MGSMKYFDLEGLFCITENKTKQQVVIIQTKRQVAKS